jgi:hypothetical protein
MTPDEIYEAYKRKHSVNLSRQKSGYTIKDEADNKQV